MPKMFPEGYSIIPRGKLANNKQAPHRNFVNIVRVSFAIKLAVCSLLCSSRLFEYEVDDLSSRSGE